MKEKRKYKRLSTDLIVFYDDHGAIEGFQFCYDKNVNEQMMSWDCKQGYSHTAIDDGESSLVLSGGENGLNHAVLQGSDDWSAGY